MKTITKPVQKARVVETPRFWWSPWSIGNREGVLCHVVTLSRSRDERHKRSIEIAVPVTQLQGLTVKEQQAFIKPLMEDALKELGIEGVVLVDGKRRGGP